MDANKNPAAAETTLTTIIAAHTDPSDLSFRGSCSTYTMMGYLGMRAGITFARSAYADALDALVEAGTVTEELTMWGVQYRLAR